MTIAHRLRERITGGAPLIPLAILFGLNAVDELDRTAFAILTPEIRDAFGLENEGILGVISLVFILALLGQVLIGYYADRFSRTRLAIVGAAVWCIFTLGTGLAPVIGVLVLMRAFSATGRAVNDPTHRSLLADYYPPAVRPVRRPSDRRPARAGVLVARALPPLLDPDGHPHRPRDLEAARPDAWGA
jgi:MFS family permease